MTTFAVEIQVSKEALVRNLQLLPASHVLVLCIARVCFYISLWGIQVRYIGIIFLLNCEDFLLVSVAYFLLPSLKM